MGADVPELSRTVASFQHLPKVQIFFVISRKMKVLNISTSDGGNFKVDWDVARQSQTIRTMLDDLSIDEDSNNEDTLPLTNKEVTGDVFKKSLIWMEHNRGEPDFQEDTDDDELKPKETKSRVSSTLWSKVSPCKFKAKLALKKSEKCSTLKIQSGLLRNCKSSRMNMLGPTRP